MTQPTDTEIEALGHRMCWRYKHSIDPHHSSTYTFNRTTLIDFARDLLAKWGSQPVACEPLIRQLVAALEGYRRNHNDTQPCDAEREGRAWLEGTQ